MNSAEPTKGPVTQVHAVNNEKACHPLTAWARLRTNPADRDQEARSPSPALPQRAQYRYPPILGTARSAHKYLLSTYYMLDGGLWATRGHREPAGRRSSCGGQGCPAPENHAPGVPREAAPMPQALVKAQSLSPTSCYVSGARKPPEAGGCCAGSAQAAPMMAGRLAQLRRTGWA